MSNPLEKYRRLKDKQAKLQSEVDKAAGRLEQLKERLEKEFGCKTIKAAKKLVAELDDEHKKASRELDIAMHAFEDAYKQYREDPKDDS